MHDNSNDSTDQPNRRLAAVVDVDGVWYGPDSDPADVAKVAHRITNPKAWTSAVPGGGQSPGPGGTRAGTSGGARLARTVDVLGVQYGPDDHVPDDIARHIRNPKAWEGGEVPDLGPTDPGAGAGGAGGAGAPARRTSVHR